MFNKLNTNFHIEVLTSFEITSYIYFSKQRVNKLGHGEKYQQNLTSQFCSLLDIYVSPFQSMHAYAFMPGMLDSLKTFLLIIKEQRGLGEKSKVSQRFPILRQFDWSKLRSLQQRPLFSLIIFISEIILRSGDNHLILYSSRLHLCMQR